MTHATYNRENYPFKLYTSAESWDICADEKGNCAAIPCNPDSGHKPSHFGNLEHVSRLAIRDHEASYEVVAIMPDGTKARVSDKDVSEWSHWHKAYDVARYFIKNHGALAFVQVA